MNVWISTPAGGGLVSDARIDISDHAFTVGDAVYETLRTDDGRPMWLSEHLLRLRASLSIMQLVGPSDAEIEAAITAVTEETGSGRLRITVSSGSGAAGLARSDGWSLVATWQPLPVFKSSIRLATSSIRRNQHSLLVHAKVTSLAESALALHQANSANADEALLLNLDGDIAECSGSNFFLVIAGRALTPPLSAGVLPGTVRNWLVHKGHVEQQSLTLADLQSADEAFVTSATRLLTPVAQIDQLTFNSRGPISSKLRELLFAEVGK